MKYDYKILLIREKTHQQIKLLAEKKEMSMMLFMKQLIMETYIKEISEKTTPNTNE
jgi:hypothetical protein